MDGSMYFAPQRNSQYEYYNNGIVSENILGSIRIDFGGEEYDIKGLTIDFSDCYPVDFTVETNQIKKHIPETKKDIGKHNKMLWKARDNMLPTNKAREIQQIERNGYLHILQAWKSGWRNENKLVFGNGAGNE